MKKPLLFVLLLCVKIVRMDGGQAATDMAFYFGVHSVNPIRGVFPMKGACKDSKWPVLTVVEVGGDGEERVVVLRLEYNASVCPVSALSHETAIDIDPTPLQTAPTIPDVGERHNDGSRKVDGVSVDREGGGGGGGGEGGGGGGGGGGPGGGGGDPGGEGPDGNSDTIRDSDGDSNERNGAVGETLSRFQRKRLKKLAKISISIAAQTGIALVALPRDKLTCIVYLVVALSVCSYFFCLFSIISKNKSAAAITAAIGTLLAAVGFLLTMCVIVLPSSVWLFVLSSLLLCISIGFFSLS